MTDHTTTRTFWASVLAKATTGELVQMVETLSARHAALPNQADSDLLVLARSTLRSRFGGGGARPPAHEAAAR